MKIIVTVGENWETNDMGIANYGSREKPVPMEEIKEGYNLFSVLGSGAPRAEVSSFKDGVLVFKFNGQTITLQPGHTWDSPSYVEDNPYIYEASSYMVSVRIDYQLTDAQEKQIAERAAELITQMRENAWSEDHKVWKNIPLAKELLDIVSNKLPLSGKYFDATGIMYLCDCIFVDELLQERDVPRLCLEFLSMRRKANDARKTTDEKVDQKYILGVIEADKIKNRLDFYIDPHVSMEWWVNYVSAHLYFDPVERTQEWEDVIYDVEKACDEILKDEPHGMGFCFSYWSTKRAELAKRGIQWRTPHQMNPRVMFD